MNLKYSGVKLENYTRISVLPLVEPMCKTY